jgi:hypothetical protein
MIKPCDGAPPVYYLGGKKPGWRILPSFLSALESRKCPEPEGRRGRPKFPCCLQLTLPGQFFPLTLSNKKYFLSAIYYVNIL